MTMNENGPEVLESPRDREDQAAGSSRSVAPSLPHATNDAQEGDALFPVAQALPIARPVPMETSGRLEFATRCPQCRSWHRHIGLGEKDAPCGAHYRLEFASKGAAA